MRKERRLELATAGVLLPLPQGARRRRKQEERKFKSPRRRSSFSNTLESFASSFCSPWYESNQAKPRISLS
jgi:hypothetical protein